MVPHILVGLGNRARPKLTPVLVVDAGSLPFSSLEWGSIPTQECTFRKGLFVWTTALHVVGTVSKETIIRTNSDVEILVR